MAARTLREGAKVPSLLNGASTWVASTAKTDKLCEELQLLYWRTMFQLPKGTPKVMIRAKTLSQMMKQKIWELKLLLARSKVRKQGSLARAVYMEQ